jgi:hypothetical protein
MIGNNPGMGRTGTVKRVPFHMLHPPSVGTAQPFFLTCFGYPQKAAEG